MFKKLSLLKAKIKSSLYTNNSLIDIIAIGGIVHEANQLLTLKTVADIPTYYIAFTT